MSDFYLQHRGVSSNPDGALVDGEIRPDAVAGAVIVVHADAEQGIIKVNT